MTDASTLLVHPPSDEDRIASALEESGCRVTVTNRATSALAQLTSGEFDCLVSEYALPGDDGLWLLDAVREIDPGLPFIMFTDADDRLASDAFDCGVDRFVSRNGSESVAKLADEIESVTSPDGDLPRKQDVSDHEPDPEEIVRAINDASMGISLSDPSLQGNPVVYVNDAWEDVTGYEREHVLGRNPRMLQGPNTDPETVRSLASAVDEGTPITVEIRNYRPDGTPWWNKLRIAPVYDEDGELVHHVGFQNDVTDRKEAERLAEERACKLQDEKRAVQQVLARVNGLLNEITRILVEDRDRRIVVQRICDEIVDAEGYTAAWIGSTNPTDDRLELTATAGLPDEVETELYIEKLPQTVREAIESEEITSSSVGVCPGEHLDAASVGARRCAIVPLVYGQKRYGLLAVYGTSREALDRRELQLFEVIGKVIATRLNAIETSWTLTADRVIEIEVAIEDESFPLSEVADAAGHDVAYVGMTCDRDGSQCELFVTAADCRELEDVVALSFVEDARKLSSTDAAYTFAITVEFPTPFGELAEISASVVEVDATPERALVTLELPPEHDVRSVLDLLNSMYEQVELRSRHERDRRERTPHEFASRVDERLTSRQRTALDAAYMNGYFEWPRPTDGVEIAETMGITRQTFHQHLRSAERKLVDVYIDCLSGVDAS